MKCVLKKLSITIYSLLVISFLLPIPVFAADPPVGTCTSMTGTIVISTTRTTQAGCASPGVWAQLGTCTTGETKVSSIQSTCTPPGVWSPESMLTGTVSSGSTIVGFGNPLCPDPKTPCDIPSIVGRLIRVVFGIVGALALVMFIYAGFLWMTGASRGEKKVQYAKEVLVWTSLGLIVIFGSYMLVNFIIERIAQ